MPKATNRGNKISSKPSTVPEMSTPKNSLAQNVINAPRDNHTAQLLNLLKNSFIVLPPYFPVIYLITFLAMIATSPRLIGSSGLKCVSSTPFTTPISKRSKIAFSA